MAKVSNDGRPAEVTIAVADGRPVEMAGADSGDKRF